MIDSVLTDDEVAADLSRGARRPASGAEPCGGERSVLAMVGNGRSESRATENRGRHSTRRALAAPVAPTPGASKLRVDRSRFCASLHSRTHARITANPHTALD